nr:peptidase dimerization domain-containing protein [Blastococcus sp. CT_GayMR20]
MLGQPRVGGADLPEPRLERLLRHRHRLAQADAVAPLRHQPVGHGARPVPGPDPADRQAVGVPLAPEARVGVLLALLLQLLQPGVHDGELLHRAHPPVAHGGGLGAWATIRRGHLGDLCVIPEPTAGSVVTAHAGALTFRLEIRGHAAHAAMRDRGVSAVEKFAVVHAGLQQLEEERQKDADPRFWGERYPYGLSIGRVRAGDWASSVPDRLVAEGRYGVRLGEPVSVAKEAFEARLREICAADPWLAEHPVRVTWVGGAFASGELPAGHRLLPLVLAAVADAGGGATDERAVAAGTDLRQYVGAGVPTLHYGPGDLHLAHGPLEKVPVAAVVTAARAFALLTLRTCGVR